ncbi:MAG: acyl-CoA dehydratase activase [Alphaproteobacteria bacterium]|uniref:Acyl-CoA dehydratase activase n=1 Tax=Candidatus Nitrobium versatile TaxID=2884831 RepID=A0A953JDT0_9BACT|nr:acyl-CoA dehydratase activase [Candidatus Nitrobium versatile]
MRFVGVDAGSVAVKIVVLDEDGTKKEGQYRRHYGHPVRVSLELLKEIKECYPESGLTLTGSAARMIAAALGVRPVSEVVAQSYSVKKLYPLVRTIIELGGEDSKLILLEEGKVKDFSMNSVCAAGTGSFLEQQAERLRISIEEFGDMAVRSRRPSKIAGRCSVFAKSDMIHLQQIATPVEDIVAGLCFAVARNFKGTIARGRELKLPVSFQGGVAANKGMARAFREVFELDELFIPDDFALMGALGAALKGRDEGLAVPFDPAALEQYCSSLCPEEEGYGTLARGRNDFFARHGGGDSPLPETAGTKKDAACTVSVPASPPPSRMPAYLGIDIGSISTNLVLIDSKGKLLAKRYLMTAGRPIDAVRRGLEEIHTEAGDGVEIAGVGTTGSGRYMIADYVGADIVKNEITAQATAAIFIDPDVDTIFEIGGQDSKYISLRNGVIVDFEMNKACAAGTGSFIEEQAEKLDISVKGEFARCAFRASRPCRLGERCTVFMENSLMANLQKGVEKDNLLAGLAYSIVQNYINRVVAAKPIGRRIFFQGGVAFNKAVVAAFEEYLDRKITVPPHHDVTGAIGMALIAMRHMTGHALLPVPGKGAMAAAEPATEPPAPPLRATAFKGFGVSKRPYTISSFECKGCPNVCEINRVKLEGEEGYLFYGGRCEKYDVRRSRETAPPDLFAFREEMLWKEHLEYRNRLSPSSVTPPSRIPIGIPYVFFFHDYLPYWATLLWELGFAVEVSPKTNRQIITLGVENVLSEACFPVKVAHGHVKYLVEAGVEAVFLPSFVNTGTGDSGGNGVKGLACPYTQTIPYVAMAAIRGVRAITPVVDLSRGTEHLAAELREAFRCYGVRGRDINRAMEKAQAAQDSFFRAIREKGREALEEAVRQHSPAVVIVGRSYNAFDSSMNLEIPRKLATINVFSLPMDMLPLEERDVHDEWPNMYWRSGQRILKAARIVRDAPELYAIYIGNFSCGPDSFILKFFNEEMRGKPFLHIEIDEHSADAGAITRCEAFLDSIGQQRGSAKAPETGSGEKEEKQGPLISVSVFRGNGSSPLKGRTVYIPRMADHAFALGAAFERCGIAAEVLPPSDRDSVDRGRRHVSGKECYPYLVTTGDMLKKVFSPDFDPGKSAFFMPSGSGPCRFGQYNVSHRLVLKKIGLEEVPIFAPNQDVEFYRDLGIAGSEFSMTAWKGIIAYELLTKCLHETRPYERNTGDAELLYQEYHERIGRALREGNGTMAPVLKRMREDFGSLSRREERRPLVGVIGEIFVRSHRFSNEDLVKKIESFGGEVWLAPIEEWVYYVNTMALRKALIKKRRSDMMNIFVKRLLQRRVEHKYGKHFKGFLKTLHEPSTGGILEKASPYVADSFEGETVLSIGKAVDLIGKGAAGIINAMPFGCMPGTIVTALLKRVSREYSVPCISIPYDGTESPATMLQLEAFMETVTNK